MQIKAGKSYKTRSGRKADIDREFKNFGGLNRFVGTVDGEDWTWDTNGAFSEGKESPADLISTWPSLIDQLAALKNGDTIELRCGARFVLSGAGASSFRKDGYCFEAHGMRWLGHKTNYPGYAANAAGAGPLDIVAVYPAAQKLEDGWIEWNGGECPAKPDELIEARFRLGSTHRGFARDLSRWDHTGRSFDIVAFRFIRPTTKKTKSVKDRLKAVRDQVSGFVSFSELNFIELLDILIEREEVAGAK